MTIIKSLLTLALAFGTLTIAAQKTTAPKADSKIDPTAQIDREKLRSTSSGQIDQFLSFSAPADTKGGISWAGENCDQVVDRMKQVINAIQTQAVNTGTGEKSANVKAYKSASDDKSGTLTQIRRMHHLTLVVARHCRHSDYTAARQSIVEFRELLQGF